MELLSWAEEEEEEEEEALNLKKSLLPWERRLSSCQSPLASDSGTGELIRHIEACAPRRLCQVPPAALQQLPQPALLG